MKRLKLTEHLAIKELEQRYRQASDVVERSQWHIIWLVAHGHSRAEVAEVTGYSPTWISTLVQRYNADGPNGVGDRRHHNPGQAALLSPALRAELAVALEQPAPDGGLWTGPKVAQWMADTLHRRVHAPRGWEVLRALGYRSYVPRPRHINADPLAQDEFKKNPS